MRIVSILGIFGAAALVSAVVLTACGGGGDDANGDETPSSSTTGTRTARTGTVRATTGTSVGGTSVAVDTDGDGTPDATVIVDAQGTPIVNPDGGTPVPGATEGGVSTVAAQGTPGPHPVSEPEATLAAATDPDVFGGDPNQPREVQGDVDDPPPGATVDPETLAPPNVDGGGMQLIVDMNASEPGIQNSREVQAGDLFRVAIVLANVPAEVGGVTAFGFDLNYNRDAVMAPTYINGSSTDRNPRLNVDGLGGLDVLWMCQPGPQGDIDDPGSFDGDGLPETGAARLGCFTPGYGNQTGTLILATVEFRALASGSSPMTLSDFSVFDSAISWFASCDGEQAEQIPCTPANVTVTS